MSNECVCAAIQLLDAIIAGDMATALEALHDDCVIHEPESLWYRGDWSGPGGFQQILGLMADKVEMAVRAYDVSPCDDRAVMTAQITMTSRATGRTIDFPVTELYQARDGQIIDMDIYYKDTSALCALVGEPG